MSHSSVAAKIRKEKEQHPERFCSDPKCLWRVRTIYGDKPCPTHMTQGKP